MDDELELLRWAMVDVYGEVGPMAGPPAWHAAAGCTGEPTELWFSDEPADQAAALEVCERCPVRIPCGDHALAAGLEYGTWGGITAGARAPSLEHVYEPEAPPAPPRECRDGCGRDVKPGRRVCDRCRQRRRRARLREAA